VKINLQKRRGRRTHRPGVFCLKIVVFLRSRAGEKSRKTDTLREMIKKGAEMKTGLKKNQKTTEILFDEGSPIIRIYMHNTDLKNRLTVYAKRFPNLCKLTDEDAELGYMSFEIVKRRLSFRLTAPYSNERRQKARDCAKKFVRTR